MNNKIKGFCEVEGVCESTHTKILASAKRKFATHSCILSEVERLRKLYGPSVSDKDIDDEVSEELAILLADDRYDLMINHWI